MREVSIGAGSGRAEPLRQGRRRGWRRSSATPAARPPEITRIPRRFEARRPVWGVHLGRHVLDTTSSNARYGAGVGGWRCARRGPLGRGGALADRDCAGPLVGAGGGRPADRAATSGVARSRARSARVLRRAPRVLVSHADGHRRAHGDRGGGRRDAGCDRGGRHGPRGRPIARSRSCRARRGPRRRGVDLGARGAATPDIVPKREPASVDREIASARGARSRRDRARARGLARSDGLARACARSRASRDPREPRAPTSQGSSPRSCSATHR